MRIFTDDHAHAAQLLPVSTEWQRHVPHNPPATSEDQLIHRLLNQDHIMHGEVGSRHNYPLMLVSGHAPRSQFEIIHQMISRGHELPDGLICLAARGDQFRGFHGRTWEALPGNLHLTILLKPGHEIDRFDSCAIALPAVSIIEAIHRIAPSLITCGIKWVNDIVINGAKTGGVLTRSQMTGKIVEYLILGIGVNVSQSPQLPPDPFVPATCHLNQFAPCSVRDLLWLLLESAEQNYKLLRRGMSSMLIEKYQKYSVITGKEIAVFSDIHGKLPEELHRGKVIRIGENLELFLQNNPEPIRSGRLAFLTDLS